VPESTTATEAPAPPPPALQATAPLELETAIEAWPAVVELVRSQNAMLAALLQDARPVGAGDRELVLAFPEGAAFLKRKAEQEDHRRMAVDAFATVTGRRLQLTYELRENGEGASGGDATLSGEELVRRFMEEFDAQEIFDDDADTGTN
jgi:hypothetical protein